MTHADAILMLTDTTDAPGLMERLKHRGIEPTPAMSLEHCRDAYLAHRSRLTDGGAARRFGVIVDMDLPEGDGLIALDLLSAVGPLPPTVFRADPARREQAEPARAAGARVLTATAEPGLVASALAALLQAPRGDTPPATVPPPGDADRPKLPDYPLLADTGYGRLNDRILNGIRSLTPMQTAVFRLLGAGASNKVIAANLRIEARTTEKHLQNIRQRIGIRDTRSLTALAGLVTFQRK